MSRQACCTSHHYEGCADGGPGCCSRCSVNPGGPTPAERVAAVVRDLFGYGCENPPPMGITMDVAGECGKCGPCTRDWMPEAVAILAAAQPAERTKP